MYVLFLYVYNICDIIYIIIANKMAQTEISTHIPPSNNSWQPYWDQTALWELSMEVGDCGTLEQPKTQEGSVE